MKRLGLTGILLPLLWAMSLAAAPRVWTDAAGATMQAEFIRESNGEVSFLKEGKLITMQLDQLAESDQLIVRDLQAGRPVREEPSVAPLAPEASLPARGVQPFDPPGSNGDDKLPKALRRKAMPIVNRTWTDVFGNQLTAKFVRVYDGNVVLSRMGRMTTVRFHTLTPEDQDYVKELLTSQGQESLIPPRVGMPPRNPAQAFPADAEGPPVEVAPVPLPQPEFAARAAEARKGPSAFFEEMRQRDEDRRQKQSQAFAENEQQRSELQQHPTSADGSEPTPSAAGDAPAGSGAGANSAVHSPVPIQATKLLILAIVVGGVIGTVSVVVFVAMTIASASSVARQREYR